MLTHTPSLLRRPLFVAGLGSLAILGTLAAPVAAQGVPPERALLNAVAAPYTVATDVAQPDGERALLVRSVTGASDGLQIVARWQEESPAVDGDRALRGAVPQTTRRRLTLAQ